MERTTQSGYRQFQLVRAEELARHGKWKELLVECDGMLNTGKSALFSNPRVWALKSYALVWLGRRLDADRAHREVINASREDQLEEYHMQYVAQLLKFYSQKSDLESFNEVFDAVDVGSYREEYGLGRIAAQIGAIRYRSGMKASRHYYRNQHLGEAAICCGLAERIWSNEDESVPDDVRTQNLRTWALALANQSHGWQNTKLAQVLELLQAASPDEAATFRRKLFWRRWLGFTIYL